MLNQLVVINADGCSTNVSVGEKFSKLFGLFSPTIRFVQQSAEGSLKLLAN